MPLLAAFIGTIFSSVASFFATYLSKRVAISLAVIAVLVAVTAAFVTAIQALIAGVMVAAPAEVAIAAGWFLPSNTDECIAAIGSAHALRWAYDWNTRLPLLRAL